MMTQLVLLLWPYNSTYKFEKLFPQPFSYNFFYQFNSLHFKILKKFFTVSRETFQVCPTYAKRLAKKYFFGYLFQKTEWEFFMRSLAPVFNLEDFEGPLDLLLHLVENKELDIYRVVIDQILSQYQIHLNTLNEHNLDLGAEFLSIISTLMLLKSKTLLPEEKEENEAVDEGALRLDIIEQLVHYYKFRDMALTLSEKENQQSSKYFRGVNQEALFEERDAPLKPTSESILSELFMKVLEKKRLSDTRLIEEEDYRVSDKIKEIKHILKECKSKLFEEIFYYKKPKNELIALFIALLELLKQGFAKLNQSQEHWIIESTKGQ